MAFVHLIFYGDNDCKITSLFLYLFNSDGEVSINPFLKLLLGAVKVITPRENV